MNDSMHHEHDLDLISSLAEGTLADPAPAQDLVASCPECADLYRAHVTVRQAVAGESPPALTDIERARLHSSLWEQVGRGRVPAAHASSPWWYRLAPVAAVVVVVVGIGVGGWLGSGEDAALDASRESLSAETDAAGDGDDGSPQLGPLSDSPAAPEATEAPADTMAADTTAAAGSQESAGGADFTASEVREAMEEFRRRVAAEGGSVPDRFECEAPEAVTAPILAVEETTVEGEPAWFVAFGELDDVRSVAAYRQANCEILRHDR